jgi:hypothetical protein
MRALLLAAGRPDPAIQFAGFGFRKKSLDKEKRNLSFEGQGDALLDGKDPLAREEGDMLSHSSILADFL